MVEPIPVVDPIPPVPILAFYEVDTIPIPIPKKMESQQRYYVPLKFETKQYRSSNVSNDVNPIP